MVSFDNITANARLLCDLMDYDLDIHTVDDGADVDAILLGLKNDHCDAILCDAVSNAAAKRLGFHSFLTTSGRRQHPGRPLSRQPAAVRSQTRLREETCFSGSCSTDRSDRRWFWMTMDTSTCPRRKTRRRTF